MTQMNLLTFLPFSSPWIIRQHIGNNKTILDVGCGDGSLMLKINCDKKYKVVGVDVHLPSLKKAKKTGVYKTLKQANLKNLNFKAGSFDVVLASQVIEHISKKDGYKLLNKLEKIAKNKIIVSTPKGYVPFDPFEVFDGNPFQRHKSGWSIDELKKIKYNVYGQGSSFIYSREGLLHKYRKFKNFFVLFSYLLSPITYYFPSTSSCLVAVKQNWHS